MTVATLRKPLSRVQIAGILVGSWLLALAAVGWWAWNFSGVIDAGWQEEQLARATQPAGTPGKGRSLALARRTTRPLLDADSYCWNSLVQDELREGNVRNRWFKFDNTPDGRESHWSGSFAWWMLACAAPVHWLTGMAWPDAVAEASFSANSVLFSLALGALLLFSHRRLGVWRAGILAVTLAFLWGVEWDFGYGRPDHHGLHLIAFIGMLLCALLSGLGWVSTDPVLGQSRTEPPDEKSARRLLRCSGAFGGMGLWLGATQQMFFIAAVGLGAAVAAFCFARRKTEPDAHFAPGLWRDWACTGALVSLGFYLLEYFPFHLGMRLEVNHPLYALAWWGGGEMIVLAGQWPRRPQPTQLWVGLLALAGLPLAIVGGPANWYVLRDPMLHRIMATVSEGQPVIPEWTWHAVATAAWNIGPIIFSALCAGALLLVPKWRQSLVPWRAAALLVGLITAVVCLAWLTVQTRWLGAATAAVAVLAMVVAPAKPGRAATWALLALTVPSWLHFAVHQIFFNRERNAGALLDGPLAAAEVAWNFRLDADAHHLPRDPRVLAPLGISTALHYYGNLDTLGSLYWENLAACREQVHFLSDDAPGEPVARRIAATRGLDYVLVYSSPQAVTTAQWLEHGRVDRDQLKHTLIYRLSNPVHPTPPDWLEPMPLLDAPLASDDGARLYRVVREKL